ncbi:MAG: hypothetical protein AAGB12_04215 [Pseudomonadota bacterium]
MSEKIRLAALRLAAMHANDRDWIIERLDESSRASLQPLLDEVMALDIANVDVVYESLKQSIDDDNPENPNQKPTPSSKFQTWSKLTSNQAEEQLIILEEDLRILIIAAYPWAWREALIKKFQLAMVIDTQQPPANLTLIEHLLALTDKALAR